MDTAYQEMDVATEIMYRAEMQSVMGEIERQGTLNQIRQDMPPTANAADLTRTRADLIGGTSHSLDPRRDVAAECGFPSTESILLSDYKWFFERDPIAARVVEVWPKSCWKISPDLRESDDPDAELTPFEKAWRNLPKELQQENWLDHGEADEGNPVWEKLLKLDIACGVGTFGVLLIGLDDGKKLHEPVEGVSEDGKKKGSKTKTRNLTYLRVFPETQVQVETLYQNPLSPRNGQPEFYQIQLNDPEDTLHTGEAQDAGSVKVHWTRVVHVADNTISSDLYGVPRMRPVMNPLLSLQKLYGGDAEIWWKNASRDLILQTHPQLGGKVRYDKTALRQQLEKFKTGLQRELVLTGFDAKTLAPATADPTAHVQIQLDSICIKIEVPKRVFMGSERGELASGQDADEMDERADGRRNRFCTPMIIGPTVTRLIVVGVLPVPDKFYVTWARIDLMSPSEKATVAVSRMDAISKYVGGGLHVLMSPTDFWAKEMGYSAEEAQQIIESADDYSEEQEAEDAEKAAERAAELPPTDMPPEDGQPLDEPSEAPTGPPQVPPVE